MAFCLPYDCKKEKGASDHRCGRKCDPGPADAGVFLHGVGFASVVGIFYGIAGANTVDLGERSSYVFSMQLDNCCVESGKLQLQPGMT